MLRTWSRRARIRAQREREREERERKREGERENSTEPSTNASCKNWTTVPLDVHYSLGNSEERSTEVSNSAELGADGDDEHDPSLG